MVTFTQQEKLCLCCLVVFIATGYSLHLCLETYPSLRNMMHFIEREDLLYTIDVNTASYDDFIQVPYIGSYTAQKIIAYREQQGYIQHLDEIKGLPGIYKKNWDQFSRYLKVNHD